MTPLARVENSNSVKYPCRPFATVSKYQRSHADTHCLTNSEIERESLKKRPPGEGPGEFLHQRGQFQRFARLLVLALASHTHLDLT